MALQKAHVIHERAGSWGVGLGASDYDPHALLFSGSGKDSETEISDL